MRSFWTFIVFISFCLFFYPVAAFGADLNVGVVWDFLKTFPMEHPLAAFIISLIIGLVGQKGAPIIWFLVWILKAVRDGIFDDTEAAGALWRLAGVVNGFWPDKSRKFILKCAPRHWHNVILEGKDPAFKLVAVPLDEVDIIQGILAGENIAVKADTKSAGYTPPVVPEGG